MRGSVEQRREPMDRNRIRGIRCRTSRRMATKSESIKGVGCKSAECAPKAVELTSGDLLSVRNSELSQERFDLSGRQESIVVRSEM